MNVNPDHIKYFTRPYRRKTESRSLSALFPKDRYRPYLERRIPVDVAIKYFHSISRLSRATGISRKSIYRSQESGWFNDNHTRRIEYCANDYLTGELTPEAEAIRKAFDSDLRSRRAHSQHALRLRREMWDNPIRFGLHNMGACKFKRLIRGIDETPPKKRLTKKLRPRKKGV